MTLELAKKLRDAGFPQDISNGQWAYCNDCGETSDLHLMHDDNDEGSFVGNDYRHRFFDYPKENWIKAPTLSELIYACGSTVFLDIVKCNDGWVATDHYQRGEGKAPEEAVANLWLALNQ